MITYQDEQIKSKKFLYKEKEKVIYEEKIGENLRRYLLSRQIFRVEKIIIQNIINGPEN